MAVQYGSGPRPAAHTAKRRFLNCLETSLTPSSTASATGATAAKLQSRNWGVPVLLVRWAARNQR